MKKDIKKAMTALLDAMNDENQIAIEDRLKELRQIVSPQFVVMSGVPGVGKSTLIKDMYSGHEVIGFDVTLENAFGDGDYTSKSIEWLNLSPVEKGFFKMKTEISLLQALKKEVDIVIDETNLTNSDKVKWLKYVDRDIYDVTLISLHADKEEILKRNEERGKNGKHIPSAEIDRMFNKIEPLDEVTRKKFNEVIDVTF